MTNTRAALLALADRCEQASGPDREIDFSIFRALHPEYAGPEWKPYGNGLRHINDSSDMRCLPAPEMTPPRWTASLDAALTLVRSVKCFIAALGDIAADGLPGCCLCVSTDPVHEIWGIALGGGDPDGKLARATVSAALRALAAEAPQ